MFATVRELEGERVSTSVSSGRRRSQMFVIPIVLAVAACGSDAAIEGGSIARDSAGISIIENTQPAWPADSGWRVSSESLVEIGVADGPAEYQLYRAGSAVRLSDDRIVVANGGTNELRFYDQSGRHLFSAGRSGDGPGEFRDLQHVWVLPGDSLLAYDFFPSRLSLFSPAGEFVRSFRVVAPDGRQVIVRGPLDDGSLIVAGVPIWSKPGASTGVVRDSVPYYRYDRQGALVATVGLFPSIEAYRIVEGDDWHLTSVPFTRAPITVVDGERFHFGPAEDYEIETYMADGAMQRVVRLDRARREVRPEDIAEYERERLERAESEGTRPSMERTLSMLPYPESMPPYERALADAEGNLWVADYRAGRTEDASWNVFTPEGRLLGAVGMPAEFAVLQIGPDYVLGLWRDAFDVEHIRIYTLIK